MFKISLNGAFEVQAYDLILFNRKRKTKINSIGKMKSNFNVIFGISIIISALFIAAFADGIIKNRNFNIVK